MKQLGFVFRILLIVPALFFNVPAGAFAFSNSDTLRHTFNDTSLYKGNPPFYSAAAFAWADSILSTLSPAERIGQLFMVEAYSNRDRSHADSIMNLISNYKIGGLIFFQGGPVRQALLTNEYQGKSKIPLLVAIDGEWGLAMRLDSTIRFPRQMAMGGIRDEQLIYKMGAEIARQCKRIGIHVNFAPVVDVNNNPLNPVISTRSFGEDKNNVTRKGLAYMNGMQENGILASAKHFPGHGDTDMDSHKALPVITRSAECIDTLELFPFRKLIREGLGSMMVAHLFIPAYDSSQNTASTLSKNVVTCLLKEDLAFKGLVFTDALNMKGVSAYNEPGKVDAKALLAGNDMLLISEDVPKAIKEINTLIAKGEISQTEIDQRVRKILAAKYWAGLNNYKPVDTSHLYQDLNSPEAQWLCMQLYEQSLTLLKNKNQLIPLQQLDTLRIASLAIGDTLENVFQQTLGYYAPVASLQLNKNATESMVDSVLRCLAPFNLVIVSIHNTLINPAKNYGITQPMMQALNAIISQGKKVIIDVFGNPYTLSRLIGAEDADVVLMSYEGSDYAQSLSAQLIFGAIGASGKLPVTASASFKMYDGLTSIPNGRLKYTLPEDAGISSYLLARIDTLANNAIARNATPGCQVLVVKDGKVILNKSYGYHTYENIRPVKNSDLYDIASVTKIASTLPAVMYLYDRHKLNLDKKLSRYLPELYGTNKENIILREMFAHQAGLQGWIPFWQSTVENGVPSARIYRSQPDDTFSVPVTDHLFMRKDYTDSLWQQVKKSPVAPPGKYVYSDLGLIITKRMAERIAKKSIDTLVADNFYTRLGLSHIGFLPKKYFPSDRIVPTENDLLFRKQLIHGDVHDPGAAMMGGIAGHAGLFSNANDLAVMMQMFLQRGEYARERYVKRETMEEFVAQQYTENENRRGIIFDKPEVDITKNGPTAKGASHSSFGHTGFTGTCAWADPENNVIFIFLSNRVYPDASNNKLALTNVRTDIQQVIYDAIKQSRRLGGELPAQ